jgi:hypothetical protein
MTTDRKSWVSRLRRLCRPDGLLDLHEGFVDEAQVRM